MKSVQHIHGTRAHRELLLGDGYLALRVEGHHEGNRHGHFRKALTALGNLLFGNLGVSGEHGLDHLLGKPCPVLALYDDVTPRPDLAVIRRAQARG